MSDTLPVAVHPLDNAVPIEQVTGGDMPVGHDIAAGPPVNTGTPPWRTDNPKALAVFQRASSTWGANTFAISNVNAFQLVGRIKGRSHITVWCPTASAAAIILAPTEGEAQESNGITLNPGDSITLPTEAPVWCLGAGAVATVAYVAFNNPAGSLGAD